MGSYDRDYMRGGYGGGSSYRDSYSHHTHRVIWIIIGINVVVFLAGWFAPNIFYLDYGHPEIGGNPNVVDFHNGGLNVPSLQRGEIWRVFTFPFVHGHLLHLAINMFMLWMFGRYLINLLGVPQFLVIYVMGSLVGAALQLAIEPNTFLIGASASIIAVISAYLWLRPQDIFQGYLMFVIPIRAKYRTIALALLGIDLALGLLSLTGGSHDGGTAYFAHVGGYAYGWLHVTYLMAAARTRTRTARKPSAQTVPYQRRRENPKIIEAEFSDSKLDYDAILDKINREGIGSLTAEERKILEKASESMKGKDPS